MSAKSQLGDDRDGRRRTPTDCSSSGQRGGPAGFVAGEKAAPVATPGRLGIDITWMIGRMSVDDPEPVWIALPLVIVVLGLVFVILGVRVAVTRRFPLAWVRVARLPASQRSQPVRRGGFLALLGASMLVAQAPFLIPMPHSVGRALFAVTLLLLMSAAGWSVLLRR